MATNPPPVLAVDSYCGGSSCEAEVSRTVALISGRWAVPILEALYFAAGAVRFRELQRRLGAISQKELTRQLTHFVHHSVVSRRERQSTRGSVEYALTERGLALLSHLDALGRWAKRPSGGVSVSIPDAAVSTLPG